MKKATRLGGLVHLEPDDVLLSHGETPHYHRRCTVSLLSSGWDQVVPVLYCRQANWLSLRSICLPRCAATAKPIQERSDDTNICCVLIQALVPAVAVQLLWRYMVKPHG